MQHSHRYRVYPSDQVAMAAEHHIDVHRQLYNHVKWDYTNSPDDHKPSEYQQDNKLPEWKRKWPVFAELHSKAAQATVARFHRSLSNLRKKKENGDEVGRLKRQTPAIIEVSRTTSLASTSITRGVETGLHTSASARSAG